MRKGANSVKLIKVSFDLLFPSTEDEFALELWTRWIKVWQPDCRHFIVAVDQIIDLNAA